MTEESTIVVIEDDPSIASLVDLHLRRAGFRVLLAPDGEQGLAAIRAHRPALVVLDVGLPGIDGLEVCRRLKADGEPAKVVFLTARADEVDRILGFELGADDYVTKPFSPRELVARVKARLRTSPDGPAPSSRIVALGSVTVHLDRREVTVAGATIQLARQEFDLLQFLCENQGITVSRRQILDGAWGHDWIGDERTVDAHIRQLRHKIGDKLPLTTVWGVGYRLG